MLIFNPKTEAWTVFRLPYPLPFYTRGLDGRIDNANADAIGVACEIQLGSVHIA